MPYFRFCFNAFSTPPFQGSKTSCPSHAWDASAWSSTLFSRPRSQQAISPWSTPFHLSSVFALDLIGSVFERYIFIAVPDRLSCLGLATRLTDCKKSGSDHRNAFCGQVRRFDTHFGTHAVSICTPGHYTSVFWMSGVVIHKQAQATPQTTPQTLFGRSSRGAVEICLPCPAAHLLGFVRRTRSGRSPLKPGPSLLRICTRHVRDRQTSLTQWERSRFGGVSFIIDTP